VGRLPLAAVAAPNSARLAGGHVGGAGASAAADALTKMVEAAAAGFLVDDIDGAMVC
jgi:hypothetical protein